MNTPSDEITDEKILALLQNDAGNEQGFRLLMNRYQEKLYWHIRRMVISHEDANDALQNTFIKVFKNIGKFEGKSRLYTWLYRIATNEAITLLNKKKKKQTTAIEEGHNLDQQLQADEYFDGDDLQRRLMVAVAQLPEKQQLVFNMRYFQEMPYKEIAAVLETSEGGLKASYHHAVKKIEAFFKEVTP